MSGAVFVPRERRSHPGLALAVAGGLALYAGLAIVSARQKSATFDEGAHLPAGFTYLALGDHRLNPEQPPLIKLLAATPLLFLQPKLKTDDEAWATARQWEFGKRFLYRWNDADQLLFWGRLPVVALGCLLCLAVFSWGRRHYGGPAAVLAFFLCVLSPDVLAHGQIVTTDLGVALFLFLSVMAFERLLERATNLRLLLAGGAVGAALATKFSGLVVLPILAVLGLVAALGREPMPSDLGWSPTGRWARLGQVALLLAGVGLLAGIVLWATYGFRFAISPDPVVREAMRSTLAEPRSSLVRALAGAAERWALLPEDYLRGLRFVFRHSEARPAFLAGRLSEEGFPYYFLATLALKTPIPLGLLLLVALIFGRRGPLLGEAFLFLPVLLYVGLTFTRSIDIGHRHLLPIYPFLFVAAGRAVAVLGRSRAPAAGAVILGALCAWYALGTLRVHPHYLAYFNEIAGGPRNGYRWLVDSNLDWGQDLKGLKAYLDARGIPKIKLSYFGSADPAYYGIDAEILPGYMAPHPVRVTREVRRGDIVAVSATNLQGVYLDPEDRPLMEHFRAQRPLDEVGYSILIYRADFAWP
jgi:hypothetical protein